MPTPTAAPAKSAPAKITVEVPAAVAATCKQAAAAFDSVRNSVQTSILEVGEGVGGGLGVGGGEGVGGGVGVGLVLVLILVLASSSWSSRSSRCRSNRCRNGIVTVLWLEGRGGQADGLRCRVRQGEEGELTGILTN